MNERNIIPPPESPAKEFLDDKTQQYVEHRFPIKTNEDNMQEDLAMKFVKDPNFAATLRENLARSLKTDIELQNNMRNMYSEELRLGKYLDVHADLDERVATLLQTLSYLEFLAQTVDKAVPAGYENGSHEKPSVKFKAEIQEIKEELNNIKNEAITKESVGHIVDQYNAIVIKQKKLKEILNISDPSLN